VKKQDPQQLLMTECKILGTDTFGTFRKLNEDLIEMSATQNLNVKNELNKWMT
jgi:hypothetical protein